MQSRTIINELTLPPEQRSTGWWIFHKLFRVRVPNIQLMSADYIKHFGTMDSGDVQQNFTSSNELIDTMKSIADLAELHDGGCEIRVLKYEDTAEIYRLVSNHLEAWQRQISNALYPGVVPFEDLIKLDAFATAVHGHAKFIMPAGFLQSGMMKQLTNALGTSSPGKIRAAIEAREAQAQFASTIPTTDEDPNLKLFPPRKSMADVFRPASTKAPATTERNWRSIKNGH